MAKTNNISVKQGPEGTSYIANIGSILYNDRIVQVTNKVIPIFDQDFFSLTGDKGKYSAINVYYNVDAGRFVFDQLGKYTSKKGFIQSKSLWNVLPVAQFHVKQDLSSFIVIEVYEHTEMATYAVSSEFLQGITGPQGLQGYPGITGIRGYQGLTGARGYRGLTGLKGITGVGEQGSKGVQGVTGSDYDYTFLMDIGFESNRKGALDSSPYERDCPYYYSKMGGETGFIGTRGSATGMVDSNFKKVTGIIDTAHDITFAGGLAEYRREEYLPISGAISCWLKINKRPRALFSFTPVVNTLGFNFIDESRLFPTEWYWDFGDGFTSIAQNPTHTYGGHGNFVVTLRVVNENGESYRYAEVTV